MSDHTAAELLARARREIAAATSRNRFLDLLETGRVPQERLVWLVGEEYRIVRSDRRSFALLAARYPDSPSGELFLGLAQGETQALGLLDDLASALGESEKNLRAYEPRPFAQTYPAFLAQRATFGTASEVALAMLANLEEWGAYCARAADALRGAYDMDDAAVAFFSFFAESPPGFEDRALAVVAAGLAADDDPEEIALAARLLHTYETAFWDALAEGL
ncbi:hypothetical protein [Actinomadura litoris]|uniref:hypothetical protein n=1 Tax=Actinomadura litoris TaxID=2678616 RepID=UPI001FA7A51D|nr:hypothetical protein [Actinomadura litoris]